jgi:hypothetical protein
MASAKDIIVKPINAQAANNVVKRIHYSGKIVPNSQLHFGVYLGEKLEGAMSFGPSMDKRKTLGLVKNTGWNGFLELNRMAFSDLLPRNSESRAMAVAFRLIKKHYPHIEWIVSFSDGTQCGDGTIYRAAGFSLCGIKENKQILEWKGQKIAKKSLDNENYPKPNGKYFSRYLLETGQAKPLEGFQLRYIYFLNPAARERLSVPVLPFSKISDMGASMYKGEKITRVKQAMTGDQPEQRRRDTDPPAPLHQKLRIPFDSMTNTLTQ